MSFTDPRGGLNKLFCIKNVFIDELTPVYKRRNATISSEAILQHNDSFLCTSYSRTYSWFDWYRDDQLMFGTIGMYVLINIIVIPW